MHSENTYEVGTQKYDKKSAIANIILQYHVMVVYENSATHVTKLFLWCFNWNFQRKH